MITTVAYLGFCEGGGSGVLLKLEVGIRKRAWQTACLFMINEVNIRCQKNPGGWYTPYTRVYPPVHHWLWLCCFISFTSITLLFHHATVVLFRYIFVIS